MSLAASLIPNPGQAFEDFYADVIRVTVKSVASVGGAVLATAEGVPAAKLVEESAVQDAGGGHVNFAACEFWFRCDLLGFTPKPQDTLTVDPGGASEVVWVLDDCQFSGVGGVNYLCKSKVTRKR